MHAVALTGGLALFLPGVRVISWRTAQQEVQWGGILLVVAGLGARGWGLGLRVTLLVG